MTQLYRINFKNYLRKTIYAYIGLQSHGIQKIWNSKNKAISDFLYLVGDH
jgi:hypothetical protein